MKKFLSTLCAAFIAICMFAQNGTLILSTPLVDVEYQVTSMSPNGKWACGNINDGNYRGFIWDLSTGKLTELSAMGDYSVALSVSNNGIVAGTFTDSEMSENGAPLEVAGYWKDGAWHSLNHTLEDGTKSTESMAYCISPNGEHIGGIAGINGKYQPVSWSNGKIKVYECDKNNPQGAIYAISDDGQIACGWSYAPRNTYYNRATTYWVNSKRKLVDASNVGPFCVAQGLSPNAKYMVAYDRVINLETGEETMFDIDDVWGYETFSVTNDGKAVGYYTSDMYSASHAAIIVDGKFKKLQDYLAEKGVDITGYQLIRGVSIAEDEETFTAIAYDSEGLPRSLAIKLNQNVSTPAPVALKAAQLPGTNAIKLSWSEPLANASAVSGYNIYRNDKQINQGLITTTRYIDNIAEAEAKGTHKYYIKAVYSGVESESSTSTSVSLAALEAQAPRNLVAIQSSLNDVRILWDQPTSNQPLFTYTSGNEKKIGFGGGSVSFETAVRYRQDELAIYKANNYQITAVTFSPRTRQNSWTITFYDAATMEVLYNQVIDGAALQYGIENTIDLQKPFDIPADKDIILGVLADVTNYGGYDVMGVVFNQSEPGYTDLLRQKGGEFFSLHENALQSEGGAYEYNVTWAMGIHLSNAATASLNEFKEYVVYANGEKIATTSETSTKQKGVADGKYQYEVAAAYKDGRISEKVSCAINVVANEGIYKPVSTIYAKVEGNVLKASWEAPVNDDEHFITYASETNTGGLVGTEDDQYSYMAATIYANDIIRVYDGYQIKGFRFYPLADADFTFILKENEEVIAELPLDREIGYKLDTWNTVLLEEPITLSRFSKYQLILDCYDVTPGLAPLGMDNRTAYPNVSDLYSTDGGSSFKSLSAEGGKNANWMLNLVVASTETEELPIEGYHVQVDGQKKTLLPIKDTQFEVTYLKEGKHTLNVNVIYAEPIGQKNSEAIQFTIGSTGIEKIQQTPYDITLGGNNYYIQVSGCDNVKQIAAFNAAGQKVAQSAGSMLNISSLAAGVYVLHIETAERTVTAKVRINR